MSDTKMRLIDLEKMFKTWAWTHYQSTSSGLLNRFRRLNFRDATIDLKWERVKIKPRKPNYTSTGDSKADQRIVIESVYENATAKDQTHSFRTERDTTSTATFIVTKGLRKGVEAKLEMPLPEEMLGDHSNQNQPTDKEKKKVLKMATASFGNSLSLDVEEGNSVSKTLKWSVDTTITSMNDKVTVAELEVKETQAVYDLSVKVDIKGTIIAVISNTRGKQVMTVEGDVATVLNDLRERNTAGTGNLDIFMSSNTVSVTIAGKVIFKYGVSQRVKVSYGTENSTGTETGTRNI